MSPDYESRSRRLHGKMPFVAILDGHISGFMELEADGRIDAAYDHPDFQRKGVASTFERLLAEAAECAVERRYVWASFSAGPFFEHRGFTVVRQNGVLCHGVRITNFAMQKRLHGTSAARNQNQGTAF